MLYSYTAKNSHGDTYVGELEAAGREDVYARVRQEGGRILSVRQVGKKSSAGFSLSFLSAVNAQDKIMFAKNLSSMVSAGLSVVRALDVMSKQTRKPALKSLFDSLSADVSKGAALSEALGRRPKIFPEIMVSMVRAGEESGNLAESLKIVALQMEKSHQLTKRVKGAMIYPAVILSLMVVISILLLIYMVPTLTSTFEGLSIELPLSTRIIIAASSFLIDNTILVLAVLIALVIGVIAGFRSRLGKKITDQIFIKLPVVGELLKEVQSARTSRTLSSLLSAGVPIVQALEVTEAVVGNHLYKSALNEARGAIQKGETISAVLGRYTNIYPAFVSEMAAVGEETGKIAEMLLNVAVYYEDDVDERTKDLSTIIEPVLMIVIGAGVGVFALSMLAPTFSLVENIG